MSLLTNQGPHDYQATARDVIKVREADFFFINGLGLEDAFATTLKNSAGNKRLCYVELGKALGNLIPVAKGGHEHHGHSHGDHDPHAWLGIAEAIQMVERIRDELKAANPSSAETYTKNAAAYVERLKALQVEGKEALALKKNRRLVTFHESLAYFARSFGLEIVDSIEQRPGVEPDAGKLFKLIRLCKEKDVKVIAVEPQYPDNTSAKTLLQEVPGARSVIVDPLETASAEVLTPDYYEKKMRENIHRLAEALP